MSVFIKGISSHAPRQDLFKLLAKYGRILRLKTGFLDFAFVDYENETSAFAAVKGLNGTVIFGSKVAVQIAKKNQHNSNSNNNNNNDRSKPLNQSDLLYHRKDELERRPPRIIPPNLDGREPELNDKRTVIRRHDGRIIMRVDHRGAHQSSMGTERFAYRDRGSYRGRFTAARATFRRPDSYRQYSPVRSTRRDDQLRSRSVSRSRSSSRSRSRSSHSHSNSSRSSRSRSKSPARSDSKHSHSESYSPTHSPRERPARDSAEITDRTVTRRARSVEQESVRRWAVVNLSRKDESPVSDEPMASESTQPSIALRSGEDRGKAESGECGLSTESAQHSSKEDSHRTVTEGAQSVKEGTHSALASTEDIQRIESRLREEERLRAASERKLHEEQHRVEQERLKCAAAEKLRAADNERAQHELQRVRQVEAEHRKQLEDEWLRRVEEEQRLRLVAEKTVDEERARLRLIEAELQRRQREDEERNREMDRARGAVLALRQEREQWRQEREQLQQERQQWQSLAPHAPEESAHVSQEVAVPTDLTSKEKSHKRKAAQQLGTKPKRRKAESEAAKTTASEKSAPNTNTSETLVLDLTDE